MNRRVRPPVTAGVVMVAIAWICVGPGPVPTTTVFGEEARGQSRDTRFERLGTVVRQAMADIGVPGVAVGVLTADDRHTAGFGVTSVVNPLDVTDKTLFQIGSITKTMTGTAIMRLVDQGRVDLDASVQTYLPGFQLGDPEAAQGATVRQLLTHMGGWVGDFFVPSGEGDDALARMLGQMAEIDQLAPLGSTWSYNNSGFYVAGRIIEVVTGTSYEDAVQALVFEPIGMDQVFFGSADVIAHRFSVGHFPGREGARVAQPWSLFRAINPAGGAVTSVAQLLTYASFHLGTGMTSAGEEVLTRDSLVAMQTEQSTRGDANGWEAGIRTPITRSRALFRR